MATLKIAELKQQRTRERLSADVIRSAQELEHSLSRQNLGGNEDGDIDISKVVKGEDGDAFLKVPDDHLLASYTRRYIHTHQDHYC